MKRRVVVAVALVLLVMSAVGAFAYEQKSKTYPWMASFDRSGQLNLYVAAGWYYVGFVAGGGAELILGNFDISGVPFEWGLEARGVVGFANVSGYGSWVDWGAAPLVTLHWGMDFGGGAKFELYGGLGLGLYGTGGTYYAFTGYGPFFGFAGAGGAAWHFSDNFALIIESSYIGWAGMVGAGLKISL
ncbi:MAG TPA: hypothetical protein VMV03_07725 [Spirochaetia bacterium]|nr:hypothetical protein [Spirochaetia bacterium]